MVDKKKIPYGIYCHGTLVKQKDNTYKIVNGCPYWKHRKFHLYDIFWVLKEDKKAYGMNGIYDIYKTKNILKILKTIYKENKEEGKFICKYCKIKDTYMGQSLLWDQCKICEENLDDDEILLQKIDELDI